MPVIPFIPMIASTVVGAIAAKKGQAAAMKRTPEEATSLAGGQGAGSELAGAGKSLTGTGTGMIDQGQTTLAGPTNYFQKLLSGNRALQTQAVAAPRAAISDVYRGAERNLEQGGVRGASRDVAKAELGRERAGKISSLITGVQPGAAGALTDIGQTQTGQGAGIAGTGVGATSSGGNLFSNLLGQGFDNRKYGREEGGKGGAAWGKLIFDVMKSSGKFGGKTDMSSAMGGD